MCGGVAVIDFDNDGKPDLLFINACPWPGQEKSSARQADAGALSQRGRRQIYGRDERGRPGRHAVRHGRDGRRLRQRRLARLVRHRRRRQPSVSQRGQRQRRGRPALRGDDSDGRRRRAGRLARQVRPAISSPGTSPSASRPRRRSSTTTATASSICSCATTSTGRRPRSQHRLHARRQGTDVWPAQAVRRGAVLPLSQRGRRQVHGCVEGGRRASLREARHRSGRPAAAAGQIAGRDRLRRRRGRLARHRRGQRFRAQLLLPQQARTQRHARFQGGRPARRHRLRPGPSARRDGHRLGAVLSARMQWPAHHQLRR